jgi:signal transduction histidine kinase
VHERTIDLQRTYEELDRARLRERAFTGDAAHELRTPLAGLRAQADVALHSTDEEERECALRNIIDSVGRASRLVEQLLALARVDPLLGQQVRPVIDLTQLARRVVIERQPDARAARVDLGLHADSTCRAALDESAMEVLLGNLVDNAIAYCAAGSVVDVTLSGRAEYVEIRVADTGPGIPVAHRDRVFERFFRIPGSVKAGAGLGLSIVRRIVEIHDGSVFIEDPPRGRGTVMVVRFPAGVSDTQRKA